MYKVRLVSARSGAWNFSVCGRDVLPRSFQLQVQCGCFSLRVVGSSLRTRHSVVCLSVVIPVFVVVEGGFEWR